MTLSSLLWLLPHFVACFLIGQIMVTTLATRAANLAPPTWRWPYSLLAPLVIAICLWAGGCSPVAETVTARSQPPASLAPSPTFETQRDVESHDNCRAVLSHYCLRMDECGLAELKTCLEIAASGCDRVVGITEHESRVCAMAFDSFDCNSTLLPDACTGIGVTRNENAR